MTSNSMALRKIRTALLALMFLLLPSLLYAGVISVETLSPSAADLCGIYPANITISAGNIQNTVNRTFENVTATLLMEPDNSGLTITNPSFYLGTVAPGIQQAVPSWQVQCSGIPGTYTLYVTFANASSVLASSLGEAVSTIIVHANDISPPIVERHSPEGTIPTSYIMLEVVTNEDATCRYSTIPGVAYANQQYSFQVTGGKTHKAPMQNLVDNFYSFYVRCKDSAGNEALSDYTASVEINAPPTSMITLSKSSPLSLGTTEVTVTTSEPVKPVPSLSYDCNGNTVSVPVTGSGTSWKGYIILVEANVNKVCSFGFSSVDLSGNGGSYITGGNIFLIDTLPPSAPASLAAVEQRGFSVKLNWKLNTEEIEHFNVYRLTDRESDFSLYGTSAQTSFTDTAVSSGKTYAYRVSAVDEAGNEGPFSSEISLLVQGISSAAEDSFKNSTVDDNNSPLQTKVPPVSLAEIDKAISEIDSLLEEFNVLRAKFKAGSEFSGGELFLLLGPSERIKEAKILLLKKKEELGMLKNENLNDEIVREEFQGIKNEIKAIRHMVIEDIELGAEESFAVSTSEGQFSGTEEQFSSVIASYLNNRKPAISPEEKEEFIFAAKEMRQAIEVTAMLQEIKIKYLDGAYETFTFIKKKIKRTEAGRTSPIISSGTFSVIEFIPKELASSVDEMIIGKDAEIIDHDPLLQYSLPPNVSFNNVNNVNNVSFDYSYLLKKAVDIETAKETAKKILTIAAPKISAASNRFAAKNNNSGSDNKSKSWNFLTGSAVANAARNVVNDVSFYDAGIAAGIMLVVIMMIYSFAYAEKEINLPHYESRFSIKRFLPEMRGRKSENREIVLSYHGSEEYRKVGLIPLLDPTLTVLLKNIEDSIHALKFDKAVKFYHLFTMQSESSFYNKEKVETASERVKKKMILLTKYTLLRHIIKKNGCVNLHQILNEIAVLYNELLPDASEKEMPFLDHVKLFHAKYSAALLQGKER